MANNKAFKVKNGLQAGRYLQSAGTETAGSEAYNLASASYDSKSFLVTQDTGPRDAKFKPDGTKMYVIGTGSDTVYQYTLSTPWDVSTATYDSVSYSVAALDTTPLSVFLGNSGTKMYVMGAVNNTIREFTLSTAWDISTASYTSGLAVTSQDNAMYSVTFKSDGTKMYAVGIGNDAVYQYTLSTAWDLTTASYDSVSLSVVAQDGNMTDLVFKPDGTALYIVGLLNDYVFQYSLTTAWDLSTASYDNVNFYVGTQAAGPYGIDLKTDGTKMYVMDLTTDTIYQYSTVLYSQTLDLSTGTYFSFTPSGATEVSFTNPPASGVAVAFAVEINGDSSAITWPASVKWHEATTPTATATKEIYTFITTDGGTTYYGRKAGEDMQ